MQPQNFDAKADVNSSGRRRYFSKDELIQCYQVHHITLLKTCSDASSVASLSLSLPVPQEPEIQRVNNYLKIFHTFKPNSIPRRTSWFISLCKFWVIMIMSSLVCCNQRNQSFSYGPLMVNPVNLVGSSIMILKQGLNTFSNL